MNRIRRVKPQLNDNSDVEEYRNPKKSSRKATHAEDVEMSDAGSDEEGADEGSGSDEDDEDEDEQVGTLLELLRVVALD